MKRIPLVGAILLFFFLGTFQAVPQENKTEDDPSKNTGSFSGNTLNRDINRLNNAKIDLIIRKNQLQLPIKQTHLNQFNFFKGDSEKWSNTNISKKHLNQDGHLNLNPGDSYILKPKQIQKIEMTENKSYLDGRLFYAKKADTQDQKPTPGSYKMFIRAKRTPLGWREDVSIDGNKTGAYTSEIEVGLDPEDSRTGNPDSLPRPVTILFSVSGLNTNINQKKITIDKPGVEGYKQVQIFCSDASSTPILKAKSDMADVTYPLKIKPTFSRLSLESSKKTILGFGLETAKLTVKCLAEDGSLFTDEQQNITLKSENEHASFSKTSLPVKKGSGTAETEIRSTGVGEAKISATAASNGNITTSVNIRFSWPIALLIVTLVGGTIGGGVRLYRQNQNQEQTRIPIAPLSVGAVSGGLPVFATALVLGQLNVPTYLANTEAGAAVLALLGGYTGDGVFE